MSLRTRIWGAALRGVTMVAISFAAGLLIGTKRGIPFVGSERGWSIGVYTGDSPFSLQPAQGVTNPVLTRADVTDIEASFVADPFVVREGGRWYMFFEMLNARDEKGDIGLAESADGLHWQYRRVVLDEQFHLSYPYVFKWDQACYMVPESAENKSVRLYRATSFPTEWELDTVLVDRPLLDPSLAYFDEQWWMFAEQGNDTLLLFMADELRGPWVEHPASPVVTGDMDISRPGGRVVEFEGRLHRLTQDTTPTYGNQLRAFAITTLTPTQYREVEVDANPVLIKTGEGWNGLGMHHADPHQLETGQWLAIVDGFGDRRVYGLRY